MRIVPTMAVRHLMTPHLPYRGEYLLGEVIDPVRASLRALVKPSLVDALESAIWHFFKVLNDGVSKPLLPIPDTITHNKTEFHRLAVAWGLSYRADDIGVVIPPEQVGSVEPIRKSFKPMLTKDQM